MSNGDLDLSGVFAGLGLNNGNGTAVADDLAPAPPPAAKPRVSSRPSKTRQAIYFDLETIPDESRIDSFGLEPLPVPSPRRDISQCPQIDAAMGWTLEGLKKALQDVNPCDEWLNLLEAAENGKDKPRKGAIDAIAEIRGQADSIAAAIADRRKLLSVTPEFNKIVAAGWAVGDEGTAAMVVGQPLGDSRETHESDIIDRLWSLIESSGPVVGFNVLHFDLPTLFIRSALLGIKPPRRLDMKPWGGDVVDLMAARFPKGPAKKLKELAMYYGFAVPAGDFDGSQVYAAWSAGEFNQIAAYVRSDVEISRKLHQFYKGFFVA